MKPSDILPTAQTLQPSRVGLVHYEILADGLIHSAAIFGFPPDEQFVSRVGALAFCNGVRLVSLQPKYAGEIAGLIGQSLEVGRDENQRLCQWLQEEMGSAAGPLDAAEKFLRRRFKADLLPVDDPKSASMIRCIVGGSVMAGIYSRSLAPELFQVFQTEVESQHHELGYLTSRVVWWATNRGLPVDHPFIELVARTYRNQPLEGAMIGPLFVERLRALITDPNPWDLRHWLEPGWREGGMTARFAPDQVAAVMQEIGATKRASYIGAFRECLKGTGKPSEQIDLLAAFDQYLGQREPKGLGDESIRQANPRLIAACAYDFAVWMGIVAETGASAEYEATG